MSMEGSDIILEKIIFKLLRSDGFEVSEVNLHFVQLAARENFHSIPCLKPPIIDVIFYKRISDSSNICSFVENHIRAYFSVTSTQKEIENLAILVEISQEFWKKIPKFFFQFLTFDSIRGLSTIFTFSTYELLGGIPPEPTPDPIQGARGGLIIYQNSEPILFNKKGIILTLQ